MEDSYKSMSNEQLKIINCNSDSSDNLRKYSHPSFPPESLWEMEGGHCPQNAIRPLGIYK